MQSNETIRERLKFLSVTEKDDLRNKTIQYLDDGMTTEEFAEILQLYNIPSSNKAEVLYRGMVTTEHFLSINAFVDFTSAFTTRYKIADKFVTERTYNNVYLEEDEVGVILTLKNAYCICMSDLAKKLMLPEYYVGITEYESEYIVQGYSFRDCEIEIIPLEHEENYEY